MHAALLHRPRGATPRALAEADGTAGQGVDGGMSGDVDITLVAGAVAATCGDSLVLDLSFVSGSSPYLELAVTLTTP